MIGSHKISLLKPGLIVGMALLTAACSTVDGPESTEPSVIGLGAFDITRTSATLWARVKNLHPDAVPTIAYECTADDRKSETVPVLCNDTLNLQVVHGLVPGKTYSLSAILSYPPAVLRAGTSHFETLPNITPVIADTRVVSSSPVSAIVEFEIPDDGGEKVTRAGLYVSGDHDISRVSTGTSRISNLTYRVAVHGLEPSCNYTLTPFAINDVGETKGKPIELTTANAIYVGTPGTLGLLIDSSTIPGDTITIAGNLDEDDFKTLRGYTTKPLYLDLAGVNIYTISTGLFADWDNLLSVTLPASAVTILRDAFSRSPLKTLTIPEAVSEVAVSVQCTELQTIDVSPANRCFVSYGGALYDADKTTLVWFPNAFTDNVVLPAGLRAIAPAAFASSLIHSVIIPDQVKSIPPAAFQDCNLLKDVTIGATVDYIGEYAFDSPALESLTLLPENPPVTDNDWLGTSSPTVYNFCTLFVPKVAVDRYRLHTFWGKFKNIKEF